MNRFSQLIRALSPALIISAGVLTASEIPTRSAASANHLIYRAAQRDSVWQPPTEEDLPKDEAGQLIRYGRELIARTSSYLGPQGTVGHLSNGMNCQNCHLQAGTRLWGNNYAAVYATYPKFRARSGSRETVVKRITDCFERSLNGTAPDSNSREMRAMVAYMRWLGKDVPAGKMPWGTGLKNVTFLTRAADPARGKIVYRAKCQSCHGKNGDGLLASDGRAYVYPPLWGENSYNDAAGLYRIGAFAAYVKSNMPWGVTFQNPSLTNEEAWDLGAFVNSRPRPHKDQSADWPDVAAKPIDYPFGPYADSFSAEQHKFGPFEPIITFRNKAKNLNQR